MIVSEDEKQNPTTEAQAAAEAHDHPPETAENFEHTIRRLIVRRDKAREGKSGLYR